MQIRDIKEFLSNFPDDMPVVFRNSETNTCVPIELSQHETYHVDLFGNRNTPFLERHYKYDLTISKSPIRVIAISA